MDTFTSALHADFPTGPSSVPDTELRRRTTYRRAANYLSVGQIYLYGTRYSANR